MTEKEKMLAGLPYSAVDPELLEELVAVHDIIYRYNAIALLIQVPGSLS